MKPYYRALNNHFIQNKIAHRGLHSDSVSENSLESFRLAIQSGFAIEIDIHLLTDGELAVVHDSNLKRVTGQDVIIENLSSKELSNYPLLLNGEKIPTLKETLALINGQVPLLIELKFNDGFDKRQADALLDQLKDYPYKDKIALQSFHPAAVKYLKEHTLDYSVGFLTSYKLSKGKLVTYLLKSLTVFQPIKADFISYDIRYLPNKYVSKIRKKGYQLLVWTINSQEKLEKALTLADNVIFEKIEV
jgi:glycerophosphoryl diester phosphodiesterase